MFEIRIGENGEILPSGRFDASQSEKASAFFETITGTRVVDFRELDYISSSGLGVLLATQKRLTPSGGGLRIINANSHIRDIFRYSGLDQIFDVQ